MMFRNFYNIRRSLIGAAIGLVVTAGTAFTANAQDAGKEYREWKWAQAQAQREHQEYLRTRSSRDYNQWQAAQRRAQREYRDYQATGSITNSGYTNRSNNGYYNRSYNNNRRYRVIRDGSNYSTDYRGAELLRQAIRSGYSQGYQQGRNDSRYGRRYNFGGISMYRSGTYGYQSYVDRGQYQYYFQQGFEKGYEDGFYSRNRYGSVSGNNYIILGTVLSSILNIADDD